MNNTKFDGILKFKNQITVPELIPLTKLLKESLPYLEYGSKAHIHLRITENYNGLEWDKISTIYEAEKAINYLLQEMKKEFPDFALEGELNAHGEDFYDEWKVVINEQGHAEKIEKKFKGTKAFCPYCNKKIWVTPEE